MVKLYAPKNTFIPMHGLWGQKIVKEKVKK